MRARKSLAKIRISNIRNHYIHKLQIENLEQLIYNNGLLIVTVLGGGEAGRLGHVTRTTQNRVNTQRRATIMA